MFSLGVVEAQVVPTGPAPAYTMWEKGSQQFNVRFTQEVIDTWDDGALNFLMKHELAHVVLGHFSFEECKGMDSLIAADISVNYHLREHDGLIADMGGVVAKDWLKDLGLDYQAYPLPLIHEILHQKAQDFKNDMCGGIGGIGDEDDMANASTAALAARGELSEEEKEGVGAKSGTGSANSKIRSLSEARPEWAEKLNEWTQNIVEMILEKSRTHKRPSWSYKAYGLHVPTSQPTWEYKPSTVLLLVDTSGSMISLVQQIGPAIAYLNQHSIQVRVIAGDTRVLYDELVVSPPTELPGGGGTDIVPLFKHALDTYEAAGIVCFSDGEVPYWPANPNIPVLWIMQKNVKAPFGEQVDAK